MQQIWISLSLNTHVLTKEVLKNGKRSTITPCVNSAKKSVARIIKVTEPPEREKNEC